MTFLFLHNLTTRPASPTTGEKEYKLQDYLGSTRVVIAESGTVTSRTDNDAWGEIVWQSGPSSRKGYIDKETDAESNLGDYGERKYDANIGRFGSIDRYWEKYRSLTPYQYAGNNPLIMIDPTGQIIEFAEGTSEEFKQAYYEAVNYLRQSETASKLIDYLENSEEVFIIKEGPKSLHSHGTIEWNPHEAIIVVNNDLTPVQAYDKDGKSVRPAQTPALGLLHEMGHAFHEVTEPDAFFERQSEKNHLPYWTDKEEKKVIQTIENKVAQELNEKLGRKQEIGRGNHLQKIYKSQGPTTTAPAQ